MNSICIFSHLFFCLYFLRKNSHGQKVDIWVGVISPLSTYLQIWRRWYWQGTTKSTLLYKGGTSSWTAVLSALHHLSSLGKWLPGKSGISLGDICQWEDYDYGFIHALTSLHQCVQRSFHPSIHSFIQRVQCANCVQFADGCVVFQRMKQSTYSLSTVSHAINSKLLQVSAWNSVLSTLMSV